MIWFNEGMHHIGEAFTPNIDHIANRLAHINRFNGDVGQYSVAQHSVLVSLMLPPDLQLSGLLHDATEAYIGDVTKPLKAHLPEYAKLEDHYHGVIDRAYCVDTRHRVVCKTDLRMLITEAKHFGRDLSVLPDALPFDVLIDQWHPDHARYMFMLHFEALTK